MIKIVNGVAVQMPPAEITAWEAEQAANLPPEPGLPNLSPYQFHAMVSLTGHAADIEAAIKADPDPIFQAAAWSKYQHSTCYKRLDPFVVQLGAAIGLASEHLDTLWLDASGF